SRLEGREKTFPAAGCERVLAGRLRFVTVHARKTPGDGGQAAGREKLRSRRPDEFECHRGNAALGAAILEAGPREKHCSVLSRADPCPGHRRSDSISDSRAEGFGRGPGAGGVRRIRHNRLLSSPAGASHAEAQPVRGAMSDLLGRVQRQRGSGELGGLSPPSSLPYRYARRHLQPEARRLLVGPSALALSVRAGRYQKVVPGIDRRALQDLEIRRGPDPPALDLLWRDFRMAGVLLDRRHSSAVRAAHAVFCEQPDAPESLGRRRLQQEHLVAGAVAIDGLGRELAPQPPHACRVRAPGAAVVAAGYGLVLHLPDGIGGPGQQCEKAEDQVRLGAPKTAPRPRSENGSYCLACLRDRRSGASPGSPGLFADILRIPYFP